VAGKVPLVAPGGRFEGLGVVTEPDAARRITQRVGDRPDCRLADRVPVAGPRELPGRIAEPPDPVLQIATCGGAPEDVGGAPDPSVGNRLHAVLGDDAITALRDDLGLEPDDVGSVLGADAREVGLDGRGGLGVRDAVEVGADEALAVVPDQIRESVVDVDERPLLVEDVARVRERVGESSVPVALPPGVRVGGAPDDALDQAVDGIWLAFRDVAGRPGVERVRGDLLAPFAREQDDRKRPTGEPRADPLDELDARHPGHVVVADDAVGGGRIATESGESVAGRGLGYDLQTVVFAF
jgi:hypothetical protein